MKRRISIALLTPLVAAGLCAYAADRTSPEAVVRQYVQAWNDSDLDAFLALAAPDAKTWRRDGDDDGLQGRPVVRGEPQARARHYRAAFAKRPYVRVEIVALQAIDDIVVSRERVSGLPAGGSADELTVYQVSDGLIRGVWHIKRRMPMRATFSTTRRDTR